MTLAGRASPQERRTECFFDSWGRETSWMTPEQMGAYAAICAWVVRTGNPVSEVSVPYIIHASARKWRSLKGPLVQYEAITIEDGEVMIPALTGRLYRTGYLYSKTPISSKLRWRVFERDGYQCRECGSREDLTADHIEPEINGGATVFENLQTLCRPCNSRKGTGA
jgi:hypothetical protein